MIQRNIYMKKIEKWIDKPVIKVITGIRRCGKSSLMRMTIDELHKKGIEKDHILFLNLELFDLKYLHVDVELHAYIKKHTSSTGKMYVFIDEVQKCKGWESVVASLLAEENYDLYLTGSNASMLSGDLATNIAGRYIEIKVYPLCFSEYIDFNNQLISAESSVETNRERLFYDYLRYGGFPGLFTVIGDEEAKVQYLSGLRDTVVLRDTVQRHDVRDVDLLERVMAYSFDNIGQIFSSTSVLNYLKSIKVGASAPTISAYLSALADSMIIERLQRYDIKGKKIMQRMDKYYVSDLGIRHIEIGYRDNDIGQLLENVVFNELLVRGYDVYVGKEGEREIDFIANKGQNRIYIQVAYLLATPDVINREYRSLLAVKDAYPKIVLSMDKLPQGPREGVKHQYLLDFLLNGLDV